MGNSNYGTEYTYAESRVDRYADKKVCLLRIEINIKSVAPSARESETMRVPRRPGEATIPCRKRDIDRDI